MIRSSGTRQGLVPSRPRHAEARQHFMKKRCTMASQLSPISSCMYSTWTVLEDEFYGEDQVTASRDDKSRKDEETSFGQAKEHNNRKNRGYKHVPHKDKPAQVVARRNARERRRVQAVNTAFAKLRKVVPVENTRGKRISKVKTLQYAIDYINNLEKLLEQDRNYQHLHLFSHYYSHKVNEDFFNNIDFVDEL